MNAGRQHDPSTANAQRIKYLVQFVSFSSHSESKHPLPVMQLCRRDEKRTGTWHIYNIWIEEDATSNSNEYDFVPYLKSAFTLTAGGNDNE